MTRHTNPIACTWRHHFFGSGDAQRLAGIIKVKAHRSLIDVSDDHQDRMDYFGNSLADRYVQKVAQLHGLSDSDASPYIFEFKEVKKILLHMAEVVENWPKPGHLQRIRTESAMAKALATKTTHQFTWVGSWWMCIICLRRSRKPTHVFNDVPCAHESNLESIIRSPNGHNLYFSRIQGGEVLLHCNSCFAYASSNPHLLCEPCKGHPEPKSFGLTSKRRIDMRVHPVSGLSLSRPIKLW